MKKTLIILVLLFSSSVFADDISDFQIEGMSVGDSLLDYFNEEQIYNNIPSYYEDIGNEYTETEFYNPAKFNNYETVSIAFKTFDKNYIIYGIRGAIFFEDDIEGCYNKRDEISKEIQILFLSENVIMEGPDFVKHPADKSGKSTASGTAFYFENEDIVLLDCIDWSEELPYIDNLTVNIRKNEFNIWLP